MKWPPAKKDIQPTTHFQTRTGQLQDIAFKTFLKHSTSGTCVPNNGESLYALVIIPHVASLAKALHSLCFGKPKNLIMIIDVNLGTS